MGVFTLKGYFLKASVTGGAGRVVRARWNLPCSLEKSRNSSAKGSHRVVYRQPPRTTLSSMLVRRAMYVGEQTKQRVPSC